MRGLSYIRLYIPDDLMFQIHFLIVFIIMALFCSIHDREFVKADRGKAMQRMS